jgi:hypothetical protein
MPLLARDKSDSQSLRLIVNCEYKIKSHLPDCTTMTTTNLLELYIIIAGPDTDSTKDHVNSKESNN